jgi:predicted regulator of Ras-like GTPase activity (Roadblock/LC7/MglB family)
MWNSVKRLFWQFEDADFGPPPSETFHVAPPPVPPLELLRDVEGVVGSLAVRPDGALLATNMPRVFDEAALRRLARRVIQLHSVVTSDGGEFTASSTQYQTYELHVERIPSGLVGVLADDRLNPAALRMAIRAVGRRIEESLGHG